jgi:hypothetical protein
LTIGLDPTESGHVQLGICFNIGFVCYGDGVVEKFFVRASFFARSLQQYLEERSHKPLSVDFHGPSMF